MLIPKHYTIHLEPALEPPFRFEGTVTVELTSTSTAVRSVRLDSINLAYWSCKAKVGGEYRACAYTVDPAKKSLVVVLPRKMREVELELKFSGILGDLLGFYKSKYTVDGQEKYLATTQFETNEARKAFPCIDEPWAKATFDIEFVIDDYLTAISNMPVAEEQSLEGGKKLVRFERSVKMSTYLLYFGIAEWEFKETMAGKVLVRTVTTPGKIQYTADSLEFGKEVLLFGEKYFGVEYPLPKTDLIAVPDFAAGAMENFGAITFRENLLLNYPGVTNQAAMVRAYMTNAHEFVHMWFGDLVSPADWKYLWLNEGFATYYGYVFTEAIRPNTGGMDQYRISRIAGGMLRDSLRDTFAIELPDKGGSEEITPVNAPIIYSKASALLQMLDEFFGDDYRKAIKHYLTKYAFEATTSKDLFEALSEVSPEAGRVMENWVVTAGHPLVEVTQKGGSKLVLTQSPFSFLPTNAKGRLWHIPIAIWTIDNKGKTGVLKVVMKTQSAEVQLGSSIVAYKVNAGQAGFYRTRYPSESLGPLLKTVKDKTLPPTDRWGLVTDLMAQVQQGRLSAKEFIDALEHFVDEDDSLTIQEITDDLSTLHKLINDKKMVEQFAVKFLGKVLARIGVEGSEDDPIPLIDLRASVFWRAVQFGHPEVIAYAQKQFKVLEDGGKVPPSIRGAVLRSVAWHNNDGKTYDSIVKLLGSVGSEGERLELSAALGWFQDPRIIQQVIQYTLEEVPMRNKFLVTRELGSNAKAAPIFWSYMSDNLQEVEAMFSDELKEMMLERFITGAVPLGGLTNPKETLKILATYAKKATPRVKEAIVFAQELLEANIILAQA